IPILPPEDFPLVRPRADFGVKGRAGAEMHSGPSALMLSADGHSLYVLNRFTGTLATVDVSGVSISPLKEAPKVTQRKLLSTLDQKERRQGEVLYYSDLGRTSMSCDACHMDGHTEGIFFAKTHPMRIYRSPTILGSRDTPPYFTPASTFSLAQTA